MKYTLELKLKYIMNRDYKVSHKKGQNIDYFNK